MYWKTLESAMEELQRRLQNTALRRRVDEFLGNCPIPAGLHGFLARHIASATLEDCQFEERCRDAGLIPISLSYTKDAFVTNNPDKVRLLRLFVLEGSGKNGGYRFWKIYLVKRNELDALNNTPLYLVKTKWGEPLVKFHQRAREAVGLRGKVIDVSDWLKSIGRAEEYYRYFLSVFLTRGILFESFESSGFPDLDAFVQGVVLPAWDWVVSKFRCIPLIVHHPVVELPKDERILDWYPEEVLRVIPDEIA